MAAKKEEKIEKKDYDVIIVGGGISGLTAAIYTGRKLLKTLVATVDIGGQNLLTEDEENYPGYTGKSGPKLMQIVYEQAISFGAEFVFGRAVKLEKIKDEMFKITLGNGEEYVGSSVILAYGKVAKKLGIENEDRFIGRGISTCANCDTPLTRNKTVVVLGGGNSALEAAELAAKFATKVYLIHRRDAFRADEITVEKVKKTKNVEIMLNSTVVKILGDEKFAGVVVQNINTNEMKELKVDMMFLEIGQVLDTEWVKDFVERNKLGEIVTNKAGETKTSGVFAGGDLTDGLFKQSVTAAGEGAIAGLSAYNWLMKKQGKAAIKADWG